MLNILDLSNKIELRLLQKRFGSYFDIHKNGPGHDNFIIEFIGPPGIGKTTYAHGLAKSLNKRKLNNISSNKIKKLLKTKLREYISFQDYHIELLNNFLSNMVKSNKQITNKIGKVRFGLSEIECDALSTLYNGIVINDEGISHHFTDILIEKIQSNKNNKIIKNYLDKRLIVFLYESKEMVLSKIKKRILIQNKIWHGHKELSDNEIMEITERDLQVKTQLYRLIMKINRSSMIALNCQNNINDNIGIVQNSIDKINHID